MRDERTPIRVMTVDDSPTIRRLIAAELARHPDIACIAEAADPMEARAKIKMLSPDVLILDIEMPRMNGLDFLGKIMTLRPMPVVMFSSLTQKGSVDAVEALSLGAVECIGKTPTMASDGTLAALPDLVRAAAVARLNMSLARQGPPPAGTFRNRGRTVLIGASTGGVDALERVLSGFPENCPPTLITQHMPADFLRSFVARMHQRVAPRVELAADGAPLREGTVQVAPGGAHHLALAPGTPMRCLLDGQERVSGHRPSVDVLFHSAVPVARRIVAAILTGMGADGADGMRALRDAGARTLAQDEDTSTVFGMPRVALENGGAERALPIEKIAPALLQLCAESRPDHPASPQGSLA